jgi:hypothetical protein
MGMSPTATPRLAPLGIVPLGHDDLIAAARREYVGGRIEVAEFEAAIEHILTGGLGSRRFPFLPAYRGFATEAVRR